MNTVTEQANLGTMTLDAEMDEYMKERNPSFLQECEEDIYQDLPEVQ